MRGCIVGWRPITIRFTPFYALRSTLISRSAVHAAAGHERGNLGAGLYCSAGPAAAELADIAIDDPDRACAAGLSVRGARAATYPTWARPTAARGGAHARRRAGTGATRGRSAAAVPGAAGK